MVAAQKEEKPDFEIETSSMEMAQHKAEVHTTNKHRALSREDREEMQLQKESSDMEINF